MADSLSGLNYGAFAPRVVTPPTVADYFGQGQALAQSVIDQQYQAQARQNLLAQQQQKAQLDALLGPIQVQQGRANVAATTTGTAATQQRTDQSAQLFPSELTRSQVDAQYAGPNAYNSNLSSRIGLTSALQGIGPRAIYDTAGNIVSQSPGLPLAGTGPSASPVVGDLPQDSSSPSSNSLFKARTTTYGINDPQSDPDTAAGRTSTGAPVIPASPSMAGTAAVDPKQIPYGSYIRLKDGSTYIAGDTGGAVKAQTASRGSAPVIDLVGRPGSVADWNDVSITPPTADYVNLTHSQKLAYHQAAAQSPSANQIPGVDTNHLVPIGSEAGITSSAPIAQSPQPSPSAGTIPYLIPKLVQGRANPATGGIIPDPTHPGISTIQYQINPDVEKLIGPGRNSGVAVSPFIKNNQFDQTAYMDASGKSTTELRQSGQKFEQALLTAKPAVDAITAYAALPDEQRNGAADNQAINNAVIAETGALPTEASRKGFLEHSGFGDAISRLSAQFTKPNDPPFLSRQQLNDIVSSGKSTLLQRAQTLKLNQQGGAGAVADNIITGTTQTAPHPDAIPAGKIVSQGGVRYQKQPDGSFKQL